MSGERGNNDAQFGEPSVMVAVGSHHQKRSLFVDRLIMT